MRDNSTSFPPRTAVLWARVFGVLNLLVALFPFARRRQMETLIEAGTSYRYRVRGVTELIQIEQLEALRPLFVAQSVKQLLLGIGLLVASFVWAKQPHRLRTTANVYNAALFVAVTATYLVLLPDPSAIGHLIVVTWLVPVVFQTLSYIQPITDPVDEAGSG